MIIVSSLKYKLRKYEYLLIKTEKIWLPKTDTIPMIVAST